MTLSWSCLWQNYAKLAYDYFVLQNYAKLAYDYFVFQENHKFLTNHVAAYLNVDMAVEGLFHSFD